VRVLHGVARDKQTRHPPIGDRIDCQLLKEKPEPPQVVDRDGRVRGVWNGEQQGPSLPTIARFGDRHTLVIGAGAVGPRDIHGVAAAVGRIGRNTHENRKTSLKSEGVSACSECVVGERSASNHAHSRQSITNRTDRRR
jgi:hypothetical protein